MPLGPILFFKKLNSFNRFLVDCNPFTLFERKWKFNRFFKLSLPKLFLSLPSHLNRVRYHIGTFKGKDFPNEFKGNIWIITNKRSSLLLMTSKTISSVSSVSVSVNS